MSKKPTKLIGLSLKDFDELVSAGEEIHVRQARLIPFYKPGDEMALASVFLSGVRLIKEFRNLVFQAIGLSRSSNILFYTEAEFVLFKRQRIDGLILVCRANRIVDAVFLEVKNKNVNIDPRQIADYVEIAKEYGVPKLLTVSNQFVSFTTQSPVNIKPSKRVSLYHLSWSYVLTMAYILLAKNNTNIADEDQVEIMKEVVAYFESGNSGIVGFTQMKPGWSEVTGKANAATRMKLTDVAVDEAVSSWLQEERDMALILSRKLGLLVASGQKKFRKDLLARVEHEKRALIGTYSLESTMHVDGAASPLKICARFDKKNIVMYGTLHVPLDKRTRGQLSWVRKQLGVGERKNPKLFEKLRQGIFIEVTLKFSKSPMRYSLKEFESAIEDIGTKEIKSFNVGYFLYLGRKFESRKGVVESIEKMLLDFYEGVFQYLKKWDKPVPQISTAVEEGPST